MIKNELRQCTSSTGVLEVLDYYMESMITLSNYVPIETVSNILGHTYLISKSVRDTRIRLVSCKYFIIRNISECFQK